MQNASRLSNGLAAAALSLALVLWATAARADIIQSPPGLTEISFQLHVATNAAGAYAAVTHPEKWWNGEHSYSGDAANMTLEAVAGGCWCEKLPAGVRRSICGCSPLFPAPCCVYREDLGRCRRSR